MCLVYQGPEYPCVLRLRYLGPGTCSCSIEASPFIRTASSYSSAPTFSILRSLQSCSYPALSPMTLPSRLNSQFHLQGAHPRAQASYSLNILLFQVRRDEIHLPEAAHMDCLWLEY